MPPTEALAIAPTAPLHGVRGLVDAPSGGQVHTPSPVEASGWMRVWRPAGVAAAVAMHGRGRSYRCAPSGEYLVAHFSIGGLDIVRGRRRYRLGPGELGCWGPGEPGGGSASTDAAWEARLLVIELERVADLVPDPDRRARGRELPGPVLRDPVLAQGFLRLHRTLASPASALEHEASLAAWMQQLAALSPTRTRSHPGRGRPAVPDPALRAACELVHDELANDLDLASLAAAAGTGRFQLIRLFKSGVGMPPHRYQIQLRIQRARTLLEAGHVPTEVAHLVGFFDQSHLNRHFTRRMGITPARYARAFRSHVSHDGWRASEPVTAPRRTATMSSARRPLGSVAQVGTPLLAGQVPADDVA